MVVVYLALGLACFAALLVLTQAVAHTVPRE